jgi:hypothetical protein
MHAVIFVALGGAQNGCWKKRTLKSRKLNVVLKAPWVGFVSKEKERKKKKTSSGGI